MTTQPGPTRFVAFAAAILLASSWAHQRARDGKQESSGVVYVHRDAESGQCSLKASSYLLGRTTASRKNFQLRSLWRFDPDTNRWNKENRSGDKPIEITAAKRNIQSVQTDQILLILPAKVGLFWLRWTEDNVVLGGLAVSGPVLCNDIEIGEPPEGMIATCVPSEDHSTAMFVPDPKIHCRD